MSKTLIFEIPADEVDELEMTLTSLNQEMRLASERMAAEQLEIEKLKRETNQIAGETRQIGEQTRQVLTQLEAAL